MLSNDLREIKVCLGAQSLEAWTAFLSVTPYTEFSEESDQQESKHGISDAFLGFVYIQKYE